MKAINHPHNTTVLGRLLFIIASSSASAIDKDDYRKSSSVEDVAVSKEWSTEY